MIYQWKCALCGEQFRVNGYWERVRATREHLRYKHIIEQDRVEIFENRVADAEKQLSDYKKILTIDIEKD